MIFDLSTLNNQGLHPFTLIYLVKNNKVLLLRRSSNKSLLANKLTGLGGHMEPGEDMMESTKREFKEETGLNLIDPKFKGTYSWMGDNLSGISHIVVSRNFKGKLLSTCPEGKLEWHQIDSLENLPALAKYQLHFLPEVLMKKSNHYSGISIYKNSKEIFHKNTSSYFENRIN